MTVVKGLFDIYTVIKVSLFQDRTVNGGQRFPKG